MAVFIHVSHRLFYVPARCRFTGLSYHQCINQLRKRLLRSLLRGYSATDAVGRYPGGVCIGVYQGVYTVDGNATAAIRW